MIQPVQKNRLHEGITHQLQWAIIDGTIEVGTRLPAERTLAEQFQVNRGTVREALKKLQIMGLVEIRHGDGVYAKDYRQSGNLELFKELLRGKDNKPRCDMLEDTLFIRTMMAPEMARLAVLDRKEPSVVELRSIIDNNGYSRNERDLLIHQFIAKDSGNTFYMFLLNFFNDIFHSFGYLYFENEEAAKITDTFHAGLMKAYDNGDADAAFKVTLQAMQGSSRIVLDLYCGTKRKVK